MGSTVEAKWNLENGVEFKEEQCIWKTAHNLSTSLLRKRSDPAIVSGVRFRILHQFLANVQLVIFGTKLCVLIPAVFFAILAQCLHFSTECMCQYVIDSELKKHSYTTNHMMSHTLLGSFFLDKNTNPSPTPLPWIFGLSLFGLVPLAERLSFLTEQVAYFTGPTVGGLLNATCGNATELLIALFALRQRKTHILKYSLLGSILSNLLLVLGTSLLCGGLAHIKTEQTFHRRQADVNSMLLLLGLICHVLPLICKHAMEPTDYTADSVLLLSRGSSIVMLVAYLIYLFFQLRTHRQFFESEEEDNGETCEDSAVIGFWCAFIWLVIMTIFTGLLSEYIVGTIEVASDTWGISVSFVCLILLPIVGNAAEHAGAIIFAFKNKLDISLGVALGSAAQISMLVVPLCVIVAWVMGIRMDLDFKLLQTACLAFAIIITTFALQDGNSHYMKGVVLCLSYLVIAVCFFFY